MRSPLTKEQKRFVNVCADRLSKVTFRRFQQELTDVAMQFIQQHGEVDAHTLVSVLDAAAARIGMEDEKPF